MEIDILKTDAKSLSANDICDVLNNLHRLDAEAVNSLVELRVPVGDALIDSVHSPVVVFSVGSDRPRLGFLGVVHGLLRHIDPCFRLFATYAESGLLIEHNPFSVCYVVDLVCPPAGTIVPSVP